MGALTWDGTGDRYYEMGVSKTVLFPYDSTNNTYEKGVAWNGVTSISDSPEGADATDLYADNIKYASFRSAEKVNGSIEAYTYPDEWLPCDGIAIPVDGVFLRQQSRKSFGLCWRTEIGNDVSEDAGYKLHFIYGATASPSDQSHDTINDSPDATTFSWSYETTPVGVTVGTGSSAVTYKPLSKVEVDSRTADPTKLATLEAIIYGTDGTGGSEGTDPRLPLPAEIISTLS